MRSWNAPSHSLFCIVSRIVFPAYCATAERGSDSRGQFDIDVTNSADNYTRKRRSEERTSPSSVQYIFNFRRSIFSNGGINGDKCTSLAVRPLPIHARISQFPFCFQAPESILYPRCKCVSRRYTYSTAQSLYRRRRAVSAIARAWEPATAAAAFSTAAMERAR